MDTSESPGRTQAQVIHEEVTDHKSNEEGLGLPFLGASLSPRRWLRVENESTEGAFPASLTHGCPVCEGDGDIHLTGKEAMFGELGAPQAPRGSKDLVHAEPLQ